MFFERFDTKIIIGDHYNLVVKGSAENSGQINRKFSQVRIRIFWIFLHQWTENIPNFV